MKSRNQVGRPSSLPRLFTSLTGLALAVGCTMEGVTPNPPAESESNEAEAVGGISVTVACFMSSGSDLRLFQRGPLIRATIFNKHQKSFDLRTREYDPSLGKWVTWHASFTSSFGLETMSARHGNELYLAGRQDDGDVVIERWILPTQHGGYGSSNPATQASIGTPIPLTEPAVELEGPFFIPPDQRAPLPPPRRSVVYEGQELAPGVYHMTVDLEGRFAIVLNWDYNLYQVPFDGSGPPQLLVDAASSPVLPEQFLDFGQYQLGTQERIYEFGCIRMPGFSSILLADPDNDGVFDLIATVDALTMEQSYSTDVWKIPTLQ